MVTCANLSTTSYVSLAFSWHTTYLLIVLFSCTMLYPKHFFRYTPNVKPFFYNNLNYRCNLLFSYDAKRRKCNLWYVSDHASTFTIDFSTNEMTSATACLYLWFVCKTSNLKQEILASAHCSLWTELLTALLLSSSYLRTSGLLSNLSGVFKTSAISFEQLIGFV